MEQFISKNQIVQFMESEPMQNVQDRDAYAMVLRLFIENLPYFEVDMDKVEIKE